MLLTAATMPISLLQPVRLHDSSLRSSDYKDHCELHISLWILVLLDCQHVFFNNLVALPHDEDNMLQSWWMPLMKAMMQGWVSDASF